MRPSGRAIALRSVQVLLAVGVLCSVLALLVPTIAGELATFGVGAMMLAAAVRLPIAMVRWWLVGDRTFLVRGVLLVLVMIGGGVLGSLLGR